MQYCLTVGRDANPLKVNVVKLRHILIIRIEKMTYTNNKNILKKGTASNQWCRSYNVFV